MLLRNNFRSCSFLLNFVLKIQNIKLIQRYTSNVVGEKPELLCHPVVIGHRGACGYAPEHTLASYALGVLMGADYIEPDLVATCDNEVIARHDNELSLTTDVAQRPEFACRRRTKIVDGRTITGWFAEDFTLQEIKYLRATERIPDIRPGNARFNGIFQIPTLQEIIDLAKSLEMTQKRAIGIIPELKHSTYFRKNGLEMEKLVVDIAHSNGYIGPSAPFCIQSFETSNLRDLKRLTELKLMQLYGFPWERPYDTILKDGNLTYGDMATIDGLREVGSYAHCVGVDESYVIPRSPENSLESETSFVKLAHAAGLKVVVYTLRGENSFLPIEYRGGDCLPGSIGNFSEYLRVFYASGIDGFFCDQPDVPIRLRADCLRRPQL